MTVRALYILGNSDLQLIDTEGNIFSRPSNLREITEKILAHLEDNKLSVDHGTKEIIIEEPIELKYKPRGHIHIKDLIIERFNFPMLYAFFDKITELSEKKIQKFELVLFATNQVDSDNNNQDTIYLAKLIREISQLDWRYYLRDIKIEEISSNPTDYTEMEKFFGNYIKNNDDINFKHNYVQITAGTPAMSFNLAINIVDFYHTILYLKKQGEKSSEAIKLDYFTKMHYKKYLAILRKSLEGFSFQTAKEVLQESPFKVSHEVEILINILIKLRNFDFDTAYQLSEGINDDKCEIVELIRKIKLDTEKFSYKIAYDLIEKYNKKNQYIETSALLAGLYDNLRQYLFTKYTGCPVKDDDRSFDSFNNYIEDNENLKERLQNKDLTDYKDNPSKPVVSAILSWIVSNGGLNDKQEKIFKQFNKLNKEMKEVQGIRNDTLYGHRMLGISEDQYESKVRNIVEETKNLLTEKMLDFDEQDKENIFDAISTSIVNKLTKDYLIN